VHDLRPTIPISPRYSYGKENYKIPQPVIEKRQKLREVAERHGVDLRTAALQFSATPDIAVALVVGAASEQQILADYSSMQVKIPAEFWAELKARKLIEQDAVGSRLRGALLRAGTTRRSRRESYTHHNDCAATKISTGSG
jgi:hypothetical protein